MGLPLLLCMRQEGDSPRGMADGMFDTLLLLVPPPLLLLLLGP